MAERESLLGRTEGAPTSDGDWPARASTVIAHYVGTVRDATTGRALSASRYVVYLSTMALIAVMVAVLALVLVVRLMVTATAYVPGVDDGETWLAYLILGGIFLAVGLFLWRKKER